MTNWDPEPFLKSSIHLFMHGAHDFLMILFSFPLKNDRLVVIRNVVDEIDDDHD